MNNFRYGLAVRAITKPIRTITMEYLLRNARPATNAIQTQRLGSFFKIS